MSWTHIEDTTPKARKEHRCILCELPIEKGVVHVARFGVDDDGKVKVRMHIECEKATEGWSYEDWEVNDAYEFRHNLPTLTTLVEKNILINKEK